jgi:hypothetical protein
MVCLQNAFSFTNNAKEFKALLLNYKQLSAADKLSMEMLLTWGLWLDDI